MLSPTVSPDHKTGRLYCYDCFQPTLAVQLAADLATNQNPNVWNTALVPPPESRELNYDYSALSEVLEEEGWPTVVRELVPADDKELDPVDEEELPF